MRKIIVRYGTYVSNITMIRVRNRWMENKFGFNREKVKKLIAGVRDSEDHSAIPGNIMKCLEDEPEFCESYMHDAGVWEGYSIGQHTLMAGTQYEKYFAGDSKDGFFRLLIAVHDLGKARALDEGDKDRQYRYCAQIARDIFSYMDESPDKAALAGTMLGNDVFGRLIKGGDVKEAVLDLVNMASKAGVEPHVLFVNFKTFFMCDAGAYTKDATIPGVVQGLYSLDKLFDFGIENREMQFKPEIEEKFSEVWELLSS